jgi:predicted nucleotidyltransferase
MMDPRDALVARLIEICSDDARIVAMFEGGSRARGESDEHSDIDVSVIVDDDAYPAFVEAKGSFVGAIGHALFVEDFGIEHMAFAIFDDGTQLEVHVIRAGDLDSVQAGPHRVLLDEGRILDGKAFPMEHPDQDARERELREVLTWFWHDLEHFTTAIGRDQLWWAAGQLEQLRGYCVNLVRLEQEGEANDEPYWKLDVEVATGTLDPLRTTYVPFDREAILGAGRETVAFFRAKGPDVASANGLVYPTELDRVVGGRLDNLG